MDVHQLIFQSLAEAKNLLIFYAAEEHVNIRGLSEYWYDFIENLLHVNAFRRLRGAMCDIKDKIIELQSTRVRMHSTGSVSEGLSLFTGDRDFIMDTGNCSVVESVAGAEKDHYQFLLHPTSNPGYIRLELPDMYKTNPPFDRRQYSKQNGTWFLRNDRNIVKYHQKNQLDIIHGLPCSSWPLAAMEYFTRDRTNNWPDQHTLACLRETSCLVVPIPSDWAHCDEWRLSFSFAEHILLRNMSESKFMLYVLLRRTLINYNVDGKLDGGGFKSYWLKTTTLWMCEVIPETDWKKENIIALLLTAVIFLYKCCKKGCLPNYFNPSCNLLMKLSERDKSKMLKTLQLYHQTRIFVDHLHEQIWFNSVIGVAQLLKPHFPGYVASDNRELFSFLGNYAILLTMIAEFREEINVDMFEGFGTKKSGEIMENVMLDIGENYPEYFDFFHTLIQRELATFYQRDSRNLRLRSRIAHDCLVQSVQLKLPVLNFSEYRTGLASLALFYYFQKDYINALDTIKHMDYDQTPIIYWQELHKADLTRCQDDPILSQIVNSDLKQDINSWEMLLYIRIMCIIRIINVHNKNHLTLLLRELVETYEHMFSGAMHEQRNLNKSASKFLFEETKKEVSRVII